MKNKSYDANSMFVNPPDNIITFSQLADYSNAHEFQNRVYNLQSAFTVLSVNIMYNENIINKEAALLDLAKELTDIINDVIEDRKEQNKSKEFGIFKQKDGSYRFFGFWSNNFMDREGEILTSESHRFYVDVVEKGLIPYPTLVHWHSEELKWGQADLVGYDEDNGVMYSSGLIFKEFNDDAEYLINNNIELAMSNGMVIYHYEEGTPFIDRYIIYEISDLPIENAANPLTSFNMKIKDNEEGDEEMAVKMKHKTFLKEKYGWTDEQLNNLDNIAEKIKQTGDDLGLPTKEILEEEVTEVEVEIVPEVEVVVSEVVIEEDKTKEMLGQISEALVNISTLLTQTVERINALENVKEVMEKQLADTPNASRLFFHDTIANMFSATPNVDTSTLGLAQETKEKEIDNSTGIDLIDSILKTFSN